MSDNNNSSSSGGSGFPWLVTAGVATYAYFAEPEFKNAEETVNTLITCGGVGLASAVAGRVASTVVGLVTMVTTGVTAGVGTGIFTKDGEKSLTAGFATGACLGVLAGLAANVTGIYYGYVYSSDFAKEWLNEQETPQTEQVDENTQTGFLQNNDDLLNIHDNAGHMEEVAPGVMKIDYAALAI